MLDSAIVKRLDRASSFASKPPQLQRLIKEALRLLADFGLPLDATPRRLERMALAFLAVADVKSSDRWRLAKDAAQGRAVTTRQIIEYERAHFHETISSGSYDDIRRKDLRLPVMADIVVDSAPDSARNNPGRGYGLAPEAAEAVRAYGGDAYRARLQRFMADRAKLSDRLAQRRNLTRQVVTLPSGEELVFDAGAHNQLQKRIIEEFLPRFGHGAEVLYVGDARKKLLHVQREKLNNLRFFALEHGELPDVVAYSAAKNWLFLVEAVHSANPISVHRLLKLRELTRDCRADLVYVSAFADKAAFRRFVAEIAWETEVWIADAPDHLVHFDGDKFLGPYNGKPKC